MTFSYLAIDTQHLHNNTIAHHYQNKLHHLYKTQEQKESFPNLLEQNAGTH